MALPTGKKRAQGVYHLGGSEWKVEVTRTDRLGKRVRRRRLVTAINLTEAKSARAAFAVELERELACGPDSPAPRDMILREFAERWLYQKRQRVRESTYEQYERSVREFLLPVLGHVPLKDLHRDLVVDFIGWLERQRLDNGVLRSDATLKSIYRAIAGFLRDAAAEAGISDPTHRVDGPRSARKRIRERRTLTRGQLEELLAAIWRLYPRWAMAVELMARTGMRTGEIRALQWGDCDEHRGLIIVQRSMARKTSYGTKTGAPRELPLFDSLHELLAAHRRQLGAEGLPVMGEALVFPSPRSGGPFSATTINGVLRKAARHTGLEMQISAQVLRRTFNTILRGHAVPEVVRDLMGHCSQEMTDRYHHTPMELRRAIINEVWAKSGVK